MRTLTGLLLIMVAASAQAGVCLTLDAARDNLDGADQAAALALMADALSDAGVGEVQVQGNACTQIYVLSHIKLGDSITVRLADGADHRSTTAQALADLPALYDRLAHALVERDSLPEVIRRDNVVSSEHGQPLRTNPEPIIAFRFGPLVAIPHFGPIPSFGASVRFEMDKWAVEPDVNVAFKLVADGEAEIGVLNFHINGLRFLQPRANHSPYLGVGLGWGVVSFDTEDGSGEGQGFQGHVFGGYEFFRASSIRMLLQVDQEVPAYGVGPGWAPLTAISVGFGYNAIHFERQRYHHRPWGAR